MCLTIDPVKSKGYRLLKTRGKKLKTLKKSMIKWIGHRTENSKQLLYGTLILSLEQSQYKINAINAYNVNEHNTTIFTNAITSSGFGFFERIYFVILFTKSDFADTRLIFSWPIFRLTS